MKNIILALIFAVTFIGFACHDKKTDPTPTTLSTTTNNGMDTTLIKGKTWVHTDTLYANAYQYDKFTLNTNGTYIRTNTTVEPNYPNSTTTETGNYYMSYVNGILNFNYRPNGNISYNQFNITKLIASEVWFGDKYHIYYIQ
jgi:hypothetical protein